VNASDEGSSTSEVPVGQLSYTDASRELDGIVEFFEQRDVDVDDLVARLERATAIVDELDRRIRRTRTRVEQLVPRLEAVRRDTESFAEDETGAGLADATDEEQGDETGDWDLDEVEDEAFGDFDDSE
jgi:exonuclease VII small subunit